MFYNLTIRFDAYICLKMYEYTVYVTEIQSVIYVIRGFRDLSQPEEMQS